jgi:hypothetical protein
MILFAVSACKKDRESNDILASVIIVNQGNFGSSTADLSIYDPETNDVMNNAFSTANPGAQLGDVAQSAIQIENELFIAINNSRKIEVVDAQTLERKRIIELPQGNYPRYMVIGNANEILVSNLFNPHVLRVDHQTGEVLGEINLGFDSEGLIRVDNSVWVTLPGSWPSYNNTVAVISLQDYSVETITVGVNPTRIIYDGMDKVWVLCAGTWGDNNSGLYVINLDSKEVVTTIPISGSPSDMTYNLNARELYVNTASKLQVYNTVSSSLKIDSLQRGGFYAISYSYFDNKIYGVDALDFVQNGLLHIYETDGKQAHTDTLRVGVVPGYIHFAQQ